MSAMVLNHRRLACLLGRLFWWNSKKISDPRHWPLWGESNGDRWIPITKGQQHGKCFHLMTSSRSTRWCLWFFVTLQYAVLEFLDLDVEPAPNCIYDYIWVVHGAPDDVNVLALVCGSDLVGTWHHDMETLAALLVIYEGNPLVTWVLMTLARHQALIYLNQCWLIVT